MDIHVEDAVAFIGILGLKWYAKCLRIDEDGDVADEFLDEVLPETPGAASGENEQKPFPKFEVKYSTRPSNFIVHCSLRIRPRKIDIHVEDAVAFIGIPGLKWYAKCLRIDEDGDVADEFLDEVLPETPAQLGLKWYAKCPRIDEDGDVADEFLDKLLPETPGAASGENVQKPFPKF
ncbi:hypothetical protein REPUB_Repub07fG0233300 [Reevesia pubescens]